MTDPSRSERQPPAHDVEERDRDARIEELLLAGLDHYFAEQYELAINVWTRVLFIDRGHARARAYIERAKGAVAERQRKGDELLHAGGVAFDRGDPAAARELVAAAVEHGASEDALALLARIDRLEKVVQTSVPAGRRPAPGSRGPGPAGHERGSRWQWIAGGVAAGVILGAAALGLLVQRGLTPWPLATSAPVAVAPAFHPPLLVPTIAEVALSNGEALFAKGRLHEALSALDTVPGGDPLRARADEITARIQRQLIAAARAAVPAFAEDARRP